ncbi:InlB B-repeat-containing protein [Dehalogenimonas etheniformans]|nr:InlB B-repeat-containing protein [Dehalogenimonas etheniformans]QNT75743.1 InlB B-repeat-containing protein [Dehalogenimonas etheniformans]
MKNRPFQLITSFIKLLCVVLVCFSFFNPAQLFADRQFTITPSAGTGGIITPPNPQNVPEGNSKSFTITPNPGYHIADVLVDGASVGAVALYTFTNVTSDHTIAASFAPDTQPSFTIVASAGIGGVIEPSATVTVTFGGTQVFTITSDIGYHIADVLVDGASVGALTSYTFTNVIADHSIAASFAVNTYTLSYAAGPGGSVNGTTPQTVNHGGSGSTVTAVPDIGYHFVTWSDGILSASRAETNVFADLSVSASFAPDLPQNLTITATAGNHGTIDPSGVVSVPSGGSQSFTATPDPGYHVADMLIDGASVGALSSYTFTNVVADHTITVSFETDSPQTFTITAGAGAGGTINPSGAVAVVSGGSQDFIVSPDSGYHIADILVDGASVGTTASYTFTNVTGDHSIAASFAINTYTLTYTADVHGSINGVSPQTVNYNGNGDPVTAVPDVGYHFVSWSDGILTASRTDINVTADISANASFAADIHTVTFDPQGGSLVVPQMVGHGGLAALPVPPTKPTFTFGGWYKEALCTNSWNFGTDAVIADITLYARWMLNSYTVTFDSQGGSAVISQSVAHGGQVILPSPPARDNYTFSGWYREASCVTIWNFGTDTVTGNVTLYAKWAELSGDGGGGGGFGSQVIAIGLSGTSPVMDGNGKAIAPGSVETSDGQLKLDIAVGVSIWNAAGAAQSFLSAAPLDTSPPSPPQNTLILAYEMGPDGVTFTPAISMTFHYADAQVPPGTLESEMAIAWWDGVEWVMLTGKVDTDANTVTAQVSHFTSFALFSPAPVQAPPTLKINTPITGTSFDLGSVTLSAFVGNLRLTTGEHSNVPGEGRVIYYLDVSIPIVQGVSALTAPGTYAEGTSESFTWNNIAPGAHTLGVQLVQNDGTPFNPPIVAVTTVNIVAQPTSTTPQSPNIVIPGGSSPDSSGGFNPVIMAGLLLPVSIVAIFLMSRRRSMQPRTAATQTAESPLPTSQTQRVTMAEFVASPALGSPSNSLSKPGPPKKERQRATSSPNDEAGEYIIRLHNTSSGALAAIRDYIQHTPEIKLLTLNNCYSDVQLCINVGSDIALVASLSKMLVNCTVKREGRIILVNGKDKAG